MNYRPLLLSVFCFNIVGCASISGFQTYNLPKDGVYQTEQGTEVKVVPLDQNTVEQVDQLAYQSKNKNYLSLFQNNPALYRLTSNDILSIQLWNYPEIAPPINNISSEQSVIATGYPLDQQGYIQLPLVGRYKATGKTLAQVNLELKSAFSRYLKQPDVVVRIISYQGQRYYVQGNVTKGGQFFLSDQPTSLYTALGMAGGVTQLGDTTSIQLTRHGQTFDLNTLELEKQGLSLHKLIIQPDDMIYVNARENQKIYVMGEAGKNQSIPMRDQGMSLSDALGESLGINATSANAKRIYVLRTNLQQHQTTLYHLSLVNIGDFGLANQFKLKSNDIIYVDATGLTRWQRVVNQIIPFSSALYNFDRLGQ